jgi:predicted ATPase/DNA-binding winged helix-turn-helix (wHTH) protein
MLRFGSCRLDVAARELWRDAELVHLEPQAFDLLVYLVTHRDRVVPKAELLDEVWGDQFVSESALTTRIKEIRRAVGDDGTRQEVVRNVRGRGYRFVAEVLGGDRDRPDGLAATPLGDRARWVIGRDADVQAVLARLDAGAAVSLVGPGGVGKTTVAGEVARALEPALTDGVVVVELAELEGPESVVPAVARAAQVVVEPDDVDRLAVTLAGLDALVVLDGCEHVVAEVARLVRRVLASAGRVRLLLTSRERLGVAGELVWPLLPLHEQAARELFIARAAAAAPAFAVDDTDPDLRAVLAALDNLPLAVEMAAARVASTTLPELLAVVSDDLPGLRSPDRGSTRRHRTLADVVSWSVDRLEEVERRVFEDVSVFAGGARLTDISGVLATDGLAPATVREAVNRLVDCSLLAADPSGPATRYRMLETVRAVAGPALRSRGDGEVLRERHARWYAALAATCDAELRTPAEAAAQDRFAEVAAELRAAHRWAVRNQPDLAAEMTISVHLYAYSRLWGEPAAWARDLAESAPAGPVRAAALAVRAADAATRGRLPEARRLAGQALEHAHAPGRAVAVEVLADAHLYEGELDEMRVRTAEMRELGEAAGDRHLVALSIVNDALAWAYGGQPDRARQVLDELAALTPSLGPSDAAWLAYVRAELADPAEAVPLLTEVVEVAARVQNHLLASVARTALAAAHARIGDPGPALAAFEDCLADAIRHGNLTHAVTTLRNLIEVLVPLGDLETAAVLYGAVGRDQIRSSYGAEATRLSRLEATLEEALPGGQLAPRAAAGRALALDEALAVALGAVRRHRR